MPAGNIAGGHLHAQRMDKIFWNIAAER